MPVIAGATRFQPVYVGDVADAVISALGRPEAAGATYELGGPRIMTFREILGWIVVQLGRQSAAAYECAPRRRRICSPACP